jgi:hypothetical protein
VVRKTIVILGCGPSGLLTALAAEQKGHEPIILSKKVKSPMFGAVYLHKNIPDLTKMRPEFSVEIIKYGDREGYAQNVYGDPKADVSWDTFKSGLYHAWDLAGAYDRLWDRFEDKIRDVAIGPDDVVSCSESGDLVFSTIPLPYLCENPYHIFNKQQIWVRHGRTHEPQMYSMMIYNGLTADGLRGLVGPQWYRYSLIRGYAAWEYSRVEDAPTEEDPFLQLSQGVKPLSTNCTCHKNIIRLGRFGKWQKGVLTHHAYEEALNAM